MTKRLLTLRNEATRPVNTPLQIHMIAASETGGAGRAAVRLRAALSTIGAEPSLSVQRHPGQHAKALGGYPLLGNPWWVSPALSRAIRALSGNSSGVHSLNLLPTGRLKHLNQSTADVLNLHWIGSDTLSIQELGKLTKPFVWTLHDMWPFCGSEHYADDAENARWRHGYPKQSGLVDLNRFVWLQKAKAWSKPGFIACPSAWLSTCVRESALLNSWTVRTIPNALDVNVFTPAPKNRCRAELGLPNSDKVILFGAQSADVDPRKGFDLVEALMGHLATLGTTQDLRCVIFGNEKAGPPHFSGIPASYLGRLTSEADLVRAYCAADIVLVPSRQENLPQVATEAQSCGRVVVAFDTTGFQDVIEDGKTGLLMPAFDTKKGAEQISSLLNSTDRLEEMAHAARTRAVAIWHPKTVAQQYMDYFQDAVDAHGG